MRKLKVWVKAFVAFSLLIGAADCGVKEYFNCRAICNKKHDCGSDSNYDVSHCVDICSDNASQNADYSRRVDTCEECEEGLSCNDYKNQAGCLAVCPSLP